MRNLAVSNTYGKQSYGCVKHNPTFKHQGVVARVPGSHAMAQWNVIQCSDVLQCFLFASIDSHTVHIAVIPNATHDYPHLRRDCIQTMA